MESHGYQRQRIVPDGTQRATIGAVISGAHERRKEEAEQDRKLLREVAAGDEGAVGRLYDRYAGLMMAVAKRMLSTQQEAEDLVHDVFVEAWRNAMHYDAARGTVRTWLLVRCRSRALDRIRAPRRSRATDISDVPEAATSQDDDPSRQADRARLKNRLDALQPQHRVLLELAYFRGLSSSEIAKREGLPLGTVKSRIAAAMRKLRAALADPEPPHANQNHTDSAGTTGGTGE